MIKWLCEKSDAFAYVAIATIDAMPQILKLFIVINPVDSILDFDPEVVFLSM